MCVGLDVHARSVVSCALVGERGELVEARLTPAYGDVVRWVRSLPGLVAVTYEAGPTGFGLARHLLGEQIVVQVAAPSKLLRPSETGSRPTCAMPVVWPGCCTPGRSSR